MKSTILLVTLFGLALGKSLTSGSKSQVSSRMTVGNFTSRSKASSQVLTCYDFSSGGGDSVRAIDYIPNLGSYNFDNRISSCCFTGTWILYAEQNYNGYSVGSANWWAYGDNACMDTPAQFSNVASSLRYTGAPDDWKYPTLNIYFNDYFIGDEEFTYNDMPQFNYNDRSRSIIVSGCQPWTVYQYTNYQGRAMCLFPSDTSLCTPGLYPTSNNLGSLAGDVSSARRGCYAKEKIYPVNYGLKSGSGSASGFFPSH